VLGHLRGLAPGVLTVYIRRVSDKNERINLRIERSLRKTFELAAADARMTLSAFILAATRVRAEQQLADRAHYSVSPEQWQAFMEALDQPPRELPRLQRLLAEPSTLEQPQ
jgi:uncharacterized protein (DUF1778 family)